MNKDKGGSNNRRTFSHWSKAQKKENVWNGIFNNQQLLTHNRHDSEWSVNRVESLGMANESSLLERLIRSQFVKAIKRMSNQHLIVAPMVDRGKPCVCPSQMSNAAIFTLMTLQRVGTVYLQITVKRLCLDLWTLEAEKYLLGLGSGLIIPAL